VMLLDVVHRPQVAAGRIHSVLCAPPVV
jgi:hypothetical protein